MCGKEEPDPSPEGKSLECNAKELRLYFLGLREWGSDRVRHVFGAMSGDDVEDGLGRNELKQAESNWAAEQTRVDKMRCQVNATAAGVGRQ